MEGSYIFCHLFIFIFLGSEVICDRMLPFRVLGLFYVGQFFAAWYTSNYLSPTIYVFSENGATSMIDAHLFVLLNFSMQVVRLFKYFFSLNQYETLSLKWCHSSFIMYYICNQNHWRPVMMIMKFLTNICTFCMRVITSNTLLSSAMIFLIPYPVFWISKAGPIINV